MHVDRARDLRKQPSDAENRLWYRLRRKSLSGYRFRRQSPIGNYIVDFVCPDVALIVELDGGQHADQQKYDEARTRWLESQGYRVLRFWNNDVLSNTDAVLEQILVALEDPPP